MRFLHPPFTGFPVAALTFLLVFELLCVFSIKFKNTFKQNYNFRIFFLALYLASILLSFISGYLGFNQLIESNNLSEIVITKISQHYSYAKLVLIFTLPLLLFGILNSKLRELNFRIKLLYYIFLIANYFLLIIVGSAGGDLVLLPKYALEIIGVQ